MGHVSTKRRSYHGYATIQEYRESYPYRREYFKYNPGPIWICSLCYKKLLRKEDVVIDHIKPLAQGGLNHVSNCTACCRTCNSKKGDKVKGYYWRGRIFKEIEGKLYTVPYLVKSIFMGSLGVAGSVGNAASTSARVGSFIGNKVRGRRYKRKYKLSRRVLGFASRLTGTLVTMFFMTATSPLRKGNLVSRMFFILIYIILIFHFLSNNTDMFATWML